MIVLANYKIIRGIVECKLNYYILYKIIWPNYIIILKKMVIKNLLIIIFYYYRYKY